MKVHVQWCVSQEDSRYKGYTCLKEEIMEVIMAKEIKELLLHYKISEGVRKECGFFNDYFYICYTLISSNEQFEKDLKV